MPHTIGTLQSVQSGSVSLAGTSAPCGPYSSIPDLKLVPAPTFSFLSSALGTVKHHPSVAWVSGPSLLSQLPPPRVVAHP